MATALVLGGGGLAGIAWEIGVLLGLRDAGVDVTAADAVIGTSAGSVAAFGANLLDAASRAPSARAGRQQAANIVDAVRSLWA